MEGKEKPDFAKELFEWVLQPLVFAFVSIVLLFSFIIGRFSVNMTSMTDTLQESDTVLVSRLPYTPKHGDIILFVKNGYLVNFKGEFGQHPLVKRVIGLAGDTIDYKDGKLHINGIEQDEPYIREAVWSWNGDMQTPLTVPEGCVFAIGDNRNGSSDSRSSAIGFIDRRSIIGRVVLRITPINRFGPVA